MFSGTVNSFQLSCKRHRNLPPLIISQYNNHKSFSRSPSITPQYGIPSIIVPGVYLSGVDCVHESILDQYNIKYVISVMNNPPILSSKYKQLCIRINDDYSAVIRPYFEEAHEFINKAINSGENILIHCYAGISRSATIVISYIMKKYKMTNDDAYIFVRNKRNIVEPNFVFCYSLENYCKEIKLKV